MSFTVHETTKASEKRVATFPPPAHGGRQGGRRICMVVYAFYENDTRVMQYADALVERGDHVDVIALRRGRLPEYEVLGGVHVHRIQPRTVNEKGVFAYASRILRFTLAAAWHLRRLERQHGYDLIHVHNVPDTLVFAAAYPKWKRVPIILDIHDPLPELFASKFRIQGTSRAFRLLTWMERVSAAFATHIIVANDLWCERLAARSSRPEKCSVVRNRPDLSIFRGSVRAEDETGGQVSDDLSRIAELAPGTGCSDCRVCEGGGPDGGCRVPYLRGRSRQAIADGIGEESAAGRPNHLP